MVELLSGNSDSPLYFEFLKELELIRDSPSIEVLAMFVDTMEYGFSELHEIGRMLEEIKGSGKTIKAHSVTGDIKTIYLLSYANERYSIEGGEYMFFLPAVESIFWGKFLKSWGVEVEAFTSGKYKSFAEPFQREKFSPEARANLSNLIVSIKNQIIDKLNKNTGLDWLKCSKPIMSAGYLKSLGFINGYIEETEFKKYHNLTNIITDQERKEKDANVLNIKKLKRKSKLLGFKFFPAPKELIMIIPLKGNINMGNKSEEDLKEGNIHAYPVIELLRS
jgi:protease-4